MWNELAKEISRDCKIKEFEEMHKNLFIGEHNNDALEPNPDEEGNDNFDEMTKANDDNGPIDQWLQNLKHNMPDIGTEQQKYLKEDDVEIDDLTMYNYYDELRN